MLIKDEKMDAGGCNHRTSDIPDTLKSNANTKLKSKVKKTIFNTVELKKAAEGRWKGIIEDTCGINADVLNGNGHPCPKGGCGGKDRFAAFKDFDETGGVMCRHCFAKDLNDPIVPGDGIATIMWFTGCSFTEACRKVAKFLGKKIGYTVSEEKASKDILEDLCLLKSMPQDSAVKYGATKAKRGHEDVIRFPLYGAGGKEIGSFDLSPNPNKQPKLLKGMISSGGKSGLHLPGVTPPKPGETWYLCEGVKDASALHHLGFEKTAGMAGRSLIEQCVALFEGCKVILVPDLDKPAMQSSITNANRLRAHGLDEDGNGTVKSIEVLLARLPGKIKDKGGEDVRDIWAREGEQAVCNAIKNAVPFDENMTIHGKRQIFIDLADSDEQQVADQVVNALGEQGFSFGLESNRIYQRAGKLVAISENETGTFISIVGKATLRERITVAVDLLERTKEEPRLVRPPDWLTSAIEHRDSYLGVRTLKGIIESPTLREDGSVLQKPGYDIKTSLYYLPGCEFEQVPLYPTEYQVKVAKNLLLDIVSDFPFKSDIDQAVWLQLALTLISRHGIKGGVPLTAINANMPGSGKSKLCDIASLIAKGEPMARLPMPPDDTETRKVITSIAIAGKSAVLFDNVDSLIGNAALDAVLTAPYWDDRVLGKSEMTGKLPWFTVLMVTGNNLQFKGDMFRRVTLCSLKSLQDHPEDRDDFKHENLEEFVLENRNNLVVAALTILRGWVTSGKKYSGKKLGSFEGWSERICGAIEYAGLPSPLNSVSEVRKQDKSGEEIKSIMDALDVVCGAEGVTSQEIAEQIDKSEIAKEWLLFHEVIHGILDNPTSRKIAARLSKYKDRVSDGRHIVGEKGTANRTYWKVSKVSSILE